jgi:hypothetical protein
MNKFVFIAAAFGVVFVSAACGDSGTGSAAIGAACAASSDCESGLCVTDDPNGQCEQACTTKADCPTGSTCTDEKKCYKDCSTNADCRSDGYACVDAMDVTAKAVKTCDVAE